jgi:hypothetical protein
MNPFCAVRLHKWEPWNPPELDAYRRVGLRIVRNRRCRRCGLANLKAVSSS